MDLWIVTRYEDIAHLYMEPKLTADRRQWAHYQQPKEGTFFRWIDDYGLMALDTKTRALQRKLIGSGLKDLMPAAEWTTGARKEALWLSFRARSKRELLERITKNRFGLVHCDRR